MSENILKYISPQQYLDLGVGVSNTGEVKLTAFEVSKSVAAVSKVNKDEFGYNYVNESKDYEKLRQFHFGIDLSNALPTASLNTLLNVDATKSLKTNHTYMHAYRKIVKNELLIDSVKLNDDALKILGESTRKFHDIYGHYYITGMTKGGALSIIGRMLTNNSDKKLDLDQKIGVAGNVSKVCKGNVGDEIAYKKSELNSYQFNECFSTSIGLSDDTKKADFTQMLNQLEELDKHIDEGSVLFYTIQKYELNSEYSRVVNQKSKWQMFIEQFDGLNLDIQRVNIDLYKLIEQNKANSQVEKLVEIDVELKLKELTRQNDYANMQQRIDESSTVLTNNSASLAVQTLGNYVTSDTLSALVTKVFQNSFENFRRIIEFSRQLKSDADAGVVLMTLYGLMKEKQLLNTSEFVQFGYFVAERTKLITYPGSIAAKEMFSYLIRNCLPLSLQRIYWDSCVSIACCKHKRFLYNSGEFLHAHNKEIKRVFTYEANNFDSANWVFTTSDCGKTFTIMNKANDEYLFLVDNLTDCVDGVFATKTHRIGVTSKKIADTAHWCLELSDDGILVKIVNAKSKECLYTDNEGSVFRGNVYACSESENAHQLFTIENATLKRNESSKSSVNQPTHTVQF